MKALLSMSSEVRARTLVAGIALLAAIPAIAGPEVPDYPMMMPAPEGPPAPGSLWNEANARVMIGMDGNARRVGDLITVRISEKTAGTRWALSSATAARARPSCSRRSGISVRLRRLFLRPSRKNSGHRLRHR